MKIRGFVPKALAPDASDGQRDFTRQYGTQQNPGDADKNEAAFRRVLDATDAVLGRTLVYGARFSLLYIIRYILRVVRAPSSLHVVARPGLRYVWLQGSATCPQGAGIGCGNAVNSLVVA